MSKLDTELKVKQYTEIIAYLNNQIQELQKEQLMLQNQLKLLEESKVGKLTIQQQLGTYSHKDIDKRIKDLRLRISQAGVDERGVSTQVRAIQEIVQRLSLVMQGNCQTEQQVFIYIKKQRVAKCKDISHYENGGYVSIDLKNTLCRNKIKSEKSFNECTVYAVSVYVGDMKHLNACKEVYKNSKQYEEDKQEKVINDLIVLRRIFNTRSILLGAGVKKLVDLKYYFDNIITE